MRGQNFASGELSSFPTTILPVNDPINFWANINGTRGLTQVYEQYKNLEPNSVNGKMFFEAVNRNDEVLKERCPVDISIENDGKCAALAELWKG